MRLAKLNPGFVNAGASLQVSKAIHDGKLIKLPTTTTNIILPPAVASGARFRFVTTGLGAGQQSARVLSPGVLMGMVLGQNGTDNTVLAFLPGVGNNALVLNRTTSGGTKAGEWFDFEDVGVNLYAIRGVLSSSAGAFASPFVTIP